jgi:hypothetical protein
MHNQLRLELAHDGGGIDDDIIDDDADADELADKHVDRHARRERASEYVSNEHAVSERDDAHNRRIARAFRAAFVGVQVSVHARARACLCDVCSHGVWVAYTAAPQRHRRQCGAVRVVVASTPLRRARRYVVAYV